MVHTCHYHLGYSAHMVVLGLRMSWRPSYFRACRTRMRLAPTIRKAELVVEEGSFISLGSPSERVNATFRTFFGSYASQWPKLCDLLSKCFRPAVLPTFATWGRPSLLLRTTPIRRHRRLLIKTRDKSRWWKQAFARKRETWV